MAPTPMAPTVFTRLSVVNAQISVAPHLRAYMFVATLLLSFVLIAGEVVLKGELNAPPSEIGDGHDYDMIGFAISKGKGFATDWEDPEFRAP